MISHRSHSSRFTGRLPALAVTVFLLAGLAVGGGGAPSGGAAAEGPRATSTRLNLGGPGGGGSGVPPVRPQDKIGTATGAP